MSQVRKRLYSHWAAQPWVAHIWLIIYVISRSFRPTMITKYLHSFNKYLWSFGHVCAFSWAAHFCKPPRPKCYWRHIISFVAPRGAKSSNWRSLFFYISKGLIRSQIAHFQVHIKFWRPYIYIHWKGMKISNSANQIPSPYQGNWLGVAGLVWHTF